MRISSFEAAGFVDFEPVPELSASSFRITAELEARRVACGDITLLETGAFLSDLEKTIEERGGRAVLEGTYDFRFTVEFDDGVGIDRVLRPRAVLRAERRDDGRLRARGRSRQPAPRRPQRRPQREEVRACRPAGT